MLVDEGLRLEQPAALVLNNISIFPFPDTAEGLPGVPGRVMGAIQFFEAQIDDQLLPRAAYDTLLARVRNAPGTEGGHTARHPMPSEVAMSEMRSAPRGRRS